MHVRREPLLPNLFTFSPTSILPSCPFLPSLSSILPFYPFLHFPLSFHPIFSFIPSLYPSIHPFLPSSTFLYPSILSLPSSPFLYPSIPSFLPSLSSLLHISSIPCFTLRKREREKKKDTFLFIPNLFHSLFYSVRDREKESKKKEKRER